MCGDGADAVAADASAPEVAVCRGCADLGEERIVARASSDSLTYDAACSRWYNCAMKPPTSTCRQRKTFKNIFKTYTHENHTDE